MKVLMLSWEYTPHVVGGLGKHVVEIVPELIAAGVEVHLVVPRYSGGEPNEPLPLPDGSPSVVGCFPQSKRAGRDCLRAALFVRSTLSPAVPRNHFNRHEIMATS